MAVVTEVFEVPTKGYTDIVDITGRVAEAVKKSGLTSGIALAFVAGSTAGITTIEYESGAVSDLKRALEQIAPENEEYRHNLKWHDGNGFSHVRAALTKAALPVPFTNGSLILGTWQQIVLMDHDNGGRNRKVIVQIVGE